MRPRKYKSPEDMSKAIEAYFEGEDKPTMSGLALHLGFTQLAGLHHYEGYSEEFFNVIKNANLRVMNGYEKRLYSNNPTGAIFALKNMGWTDRQEINIDDQRGKLSEQFKRARSAANAATSNGTSAE